MSGEVKVPASVFYMIAATSENLSVLEREENALRQRLAVVAAQRKAVLGNALKAIREDHQLDFETLPQASLRPEGYFLEVGPCSGSKPGQ